MKALSLLLALTAAGHANPRSDRLEARVKGLGDVRPELVGPAVHAAMLAETEWVSAELLLSIAWAETRLEPGNRTGRTCGPLSVSPSDIGEPRSRCGLWATDVDAAYAAGVREMHMLLADRRVHGDLRRALLYRACGNAGFNGTCHKGLYPAITLRRAERLSDRPTSRWPEL